MITDDMAKRFAKPQPFKIICNCSKERKFKITHDTFDISPCSTCFDNGYISEQRSST